MEDFVKMVQFLKKAYTFDWIARGIKEALTEEELALFIERLEA
jgi:hypothetical protein